MEATLREHDDEVVVLTDGDEHRRFHLEDDLDRATELLETIYETETVSGTPLPETRTVGDYSMWAAHQHKLFRENLWDYVRYEELLCWLTDADVERVRIRGGGELERYVAPTDVEVVVEGDEGLAVYGDLGLGAFVRRVALFVVGVLSTLLAAMRVILGGPSTLVYTPDFTSEPAYDCDFRFRAVYRYLFEHDVPFVEIFHTTWFLERFLSNLLARRRVAFYLESLAPPSPLRDYSREFEFDLSHVEAHNRPFVASMLDRFDRRSQDLQVTVEVLSWVLERSDIERLVAIDVMRYVNEILVACRLADVDAYGFQHGQLNEFQVGWMNYGLDPSYSVTFDTLYVWSDYWRDVLTRHSTMYDEANVAVSGSTKEFVAGIDRTPAEHDGLQDVTVLVPYEEYALTDEIRPTLDALLDAGATVYFKTRPDVPADRQLAAYDIDADGADVTVVEDLNEDVLAAVDCVAGTYSTLLYEMLYYEKPLLLFETSTDYGRQLAEDGLALPLASDGVDGERILSYLADCDTRTLKERVWSHADADFEATLDDVFR